MTYHAFHLTSTPGSKSLFLNAPDVFLKRRGVSVKTSGRLKKTFGFPKTGKDIPWNLERPSYPSWKKKK